MIVKQASACSVGRDVKSQSAIEGAERFQLTPYTAGITDMHQTTGSIDTIVYEYGLFLAQL